MYVANVTVLRGDRGLTVVTSHNVLETVFGVHGLAVLYQTYDSLENEIICFYKIGFIMVHDLKNTNI